ncbi:hypothetical protein ALC57_05184 [Trachymyrmex cornetzi]|uniref:GIY-YIG domain-containing protein n=1 Tax=Trachymyrmex cornetzi TaxID=471704 RepID=A0A151JBE2_9HYME|nr:hypothetical protein ALC57_05184 [Trachymyrmex cornetzi]
MILDKFNEFYPRLQFSVEKGGDKIDFLDVSIFIHNNKFIFDWYRKPTFSGRFLNFLSNHPLSQKRGTVFSLVDRAFLLSDYRFHYKNLTFIINILLDNDYPIKFIFETVNQRIKYLIKSRHAIQHKTTDTSMNEKPVSWLTVPFIPFHTEKFKRFNSNDIRVSYHSPNKMSKYIKVQKDILNKNCKNNVVYKISCNDCDASYVGQTGRQLRTRISEHRNHIKYNTTTRSVITEHRLQNNHDFRWDDVEILDEEPIYRKRLISEMVNIKKQTNSLNLQTDTEGLHRAYLPIINKICY